MFVHYRTNAIALKKEGRGEADELFTFYAKDFGKLEVLGRSIRKIDSKLRAGTDIFYLSEIEFIQGRGRKTLTDAILIEKLGRIRNNLPKLKIAHNISEALDSLVRGQEPDEKIWQLAKEAFERLNDWEIEPPGGEGKLEIIYYYFLWKLISALGYKPELYYCAVCQNKLIPQRLRFDSRENGIICQDCFKKSESVQEVSPETIKILRVIIGGSFETLIKLKIEHRYFEELKLISEKYHLALCEKPSSF